MTRLRFLLGAQTIRDDRSRAFLTAHRVEAVLRRRGGPLPITDQRDDRFGIGACVSNLTPDDLWSQLSAIDGPIFVRVWLRTRLEGALISSPSNKSPVLVRRSLLSGVGDIANGCFRPIELVIS